MLVQIIPVFSVSRDAGTRSKVFLRIGVNTLSVMRIGAGSLTSANSCIPLLLRPRTHPFVTYGAVLSAAFANTSKLFFCDRTDRIAELIKFDG